MAMKNNILFILDRAHGKDTKGKQSPDGSFREWEYSQRVVDAVAKELSKLSIPYAINVDTDKEIGLTNRVINANKLSKGIQHPILLSFHNNAGGGTGNEIFTSVGEDESDVIAHIIGERLIKDFGNLKYRKCEKGTGNLDKEKNFTVIAGNTHVKPIYSAVLIEFLFMDNPKDLRLLKDDSIFDKYIDSIIYAIVEICIHYGYGNFLSEKTIKN